MRIVRFLKDIVEFLLIECLKPIIALICNSISLCELDLLVLKVVMIIRVWGRNYGGLGN